MEGSSLQADERSLVQSRRKRSFSLPRVRRRSASADDERSGLAKCSVEDEAKTADVAVGAQKAAAWLWYARGVGEVVLPTKSPSTVTPSNSKSVIDDSGRKAGNLQHTHVPKKHLEAQPAASPSRGVSRFKAEVSSVAGQMNGRPQPSSPPSGVTPSAPLYDEFDLSGLRMQMTDFVQRLQQEQPQGRGQRQPPAGKISEGMKSIKSRTAPQGRRSVAFDPAATRPVYSTDHLLTPGSPPAVAAKAGGGFVAASSADHQPTKPSMPVSSLMPFSTRPLSALHRLFRRVVSGSLLKSSKTSAVTRNPPMPGVIHHPEMLACEEEYTQYDHHHHYIHHHHHHHYHHGESPEDTSAAILHRRRRHSESSGICPRIPSILEVESDDEEDEEVKRSPIDACLARLRRRRSDSFLLHPTPKEADYNQEIYVKEEAEKAVLMRPPRKYNSERFSPNKIPSTERQELRQAQGRGNFQESVVDIRSRRYSADHQSSRPDAAEIGGLEKSVGGGGGKTGRGTYKLGGGDKGAMPEVAYVALGCRRRHSEGFQMQPELEGDRSQMEKSIPMRAGWPHTLVH